MDETKIVQDKDCLEVASPGHRKEQTQVNPAGMNASDTGAGEYITPRELVTEGHIPAHFRSLSVRNSLLDPSGGSAMQTPAFSAGTTPVTLGSCRAQLRAPARRGRAPFVDRNGTTGGSSAAYALGGQTSIPPFALGAESPADGSSSARFGGARSARPSGRTASLDRANRSARASHGGRSISLDRGASTSALASTVPLPAHTLSPLMSAYAPDAGTSPMGGREEFLQTLLVASTGEPLPVPVPEPMHVLPSVPANASNVQMTVDAQEDDEAVADKVVTDPLSTHTRDGPTSSLGDADARASQSQDHEMDGMGIPPAPSGEEGAISAGAERGYDQDHATSAEPAGEIQGSNGEMTVSPSAVTCASLKAPSPSYAEECTFTVESLPVSVEVEGVQDDQDEHANVSPSLSSSVVATKHRMRPRAFIPPQPPAPSALLSSTKAQEGSTATCASPHAIPLCPPTPVNESMDSGLVNAVIGATVSAPDARQRKRAFTAVKAMAPSKGITPAQGSSSNPSKCSRTAEDGAGSAPNRAILFSECDSEGESGAGLPECPPQEEEKQVAASVLPLPVKRRKAFALHPTLVPAQSGTGKSTISAMVKPGAMKAKAAVGASGYGGDEEYAMGAPKQEEEVEEEEEEGAAKRSMGKAAMAKAAAALLKSGAAPKKALAVKTVPTPSAGKLGKKPAAAKASVAAAATLPSKAATKAAPVAKAKAAAPVSAATNESDFSDSDSDF